MSKASSSDVAKHAYQLWEHEGRPHGRDREHWYAAERDVLGAETAAQDRPIGEIRSAQQASERQADAAPRGKAAKPAAPTVTQAAAADTGRSSQVQGQVHGQMQGQIQGQPSAPQTQQSAQQSAQQPASGKPAQPGGAKSPSAAKRKPRTGTKQSNP